MKQKIILVIVAIIVLVGGIYIYTQSKDDATAPTTTNNTNNVTVSPNSDLENSTEIPGDPEEDPLTPTSDTIAVSTQTPGDSVTIDNAFLSKAGFISIHQVDSKGMAGTVIGTSNYLGTGPKQDLEIRAMLTPGAKYIAMIRGDNGDKKFNAQQDEAVMNNNVAVMTMFSVSQ